MDNLKSHPDKSLFTHLSNVSSNMLEAFDKKGLSLHFLDEDKLRKIVYLAGVCHDFGKSTTYFQNKLKFGKKHRLSNHALISSFFAITLLEQLKWKNMEIYAYILFIVINRHHGNIERTKQIKGRDRTRNLKKQLDNILKNNRKEVLGIFGKLLNDFDTKKALAEMKKGMKGKLRGLYIKFKQEISDAKTEDVLEVFLSIGYVFSLLVNFDKNDAANIDEQSFYKDIKTLDIKKYIKENFSSDTEINQKRSNFFEDLVNSDINKDEYIYTVTAPTGIGKTLASFGLASYFRDKLGTKKMIYSLPYTSIIDQNYDVLEKIFLEQEGESYNRYPYKFLIKDHYLNFFESKQSPDIKRDYLDEKLLLKSWESQNVVTTFVQFLESIITNRNSKLKKFHNMINSVIILDEIQAVPVKYYYLIGKVLEVFANRFNTYIVLMTATQPNIITNSKKLIDEEKYYLDPIFDRAILNTKALEEVKELDTFVEDIKNFTGDSLMVVVNTVKTSLDIYSNLKKVISAEYELKYLSTNLTPADRIKRIDEIRRILKGNKKVILVTTQLIEAGVDLSFELVYRDFSPLDSIIQVSGRCNRGNELKGYGEVKLVELVDEKGKSYSEKIYDPKLLEITKKVLSKEKYINSDFYSLSAKYFDKIKEISVAKSKGILRAIKNLNYNNSGEDFKITDFKLIEEEYFDTRIVICQDLDIEDKIFELEELKSKLKKSKFDSEIYEKFDKIKQAIELYTIDVYNYKLNNYEDILLKSEELNIFYFNNEDQEKYVYDKEIGFLEEPKIKIESSMFI